MGTLLKFRNELQGAIGCPLTPCFRMSQSQLSDLKGEVQEKDAVIAQFEQRYVGLCCDRVQVSECRS